MSVLLKNIVNFARNIVDLVRNMASALVIHLISWSVSSSTYASTYEMKASYCEIYSCINFYYKIFSV